MSAYCPEGCPDADACVVGHPCQRHGSAPESQPLTEEEWEEVITANCRFRITGLDMWIEAESLMAFLATRTADLRDRLKAAEKRAGVADRERRNEWETQAATIRLLQERAETAEADKARAVAEAREQAASLLDSEGHHWSGAMAHAFFAAAGRIRALREEVSGS